MSAQWNSEPWPFGDATGLDYVALDVKACIAHRLGCHVTTAGYLRKTTGRMLPEGIGSDSDPRALDDSDRKRDKPYACMTISLDGLSVSGISPDGNSSTSGYRSSYWFSRMDDSTIIFDLRGMDVDKAIALAVRGPMVNPALAPGAVSRLGDIPDYLVPVADDYLREYGGLAATGRDERI